jgi:hypothetical protein
MKLSQLAAKPQLIKITLDDEETVAEFGEAVEFWTWDRQPLEVFMKLANANQQDMGTMIDVIRTLILDENTHPIIAKDNMLPTNVLMKSIARIVETLGK